MTDLLLNVNLQQVLDQHLTGTWRAAERVLSPANPTTALTQATEQLLVPSAFEVVMPTRRAASQWSVNRNSLLSRPYQALNTTDEDAIALVTCLCHAPDGQQSVLNLPFRTGMELHLVQS